MHPGFVVLKFRIKVVCWELWGIRVEVVAKPPPKKKDLWNVESKMGTQDGTSRNAKHLRYIERNKSTQRKLWKSNQGWAGGNKRKMKYSGHMGGSTS